MLQGKNRLGKKSNEKRKHLMKNANEDFATRS